MKNKLSKLASSTKSTLGKLPYKNFGTSIRAKLAIGLLIPILFLAIYGIVSYKKAEDAIISSYENSASDTIKAVNKYMNLGYSTAEQSSMEMILDINFKEYFQLNLEEAKGNKKSYDDLQDRISLNTRSNYFLENIHIIGSNGIGISTISGINDNLYRTVVDSNVGTTLKEKKAQVLWMGDHSELDEVLLKSGTYGTQHYAATIVRRFSDGRGFIIFDISVDKIKEMFANYDMGEGSIQGYITPDGRETLTNTDTEKVFTNLSYYHKALESEENHGFSYEKYNGREYLFIYSKLGNDQGTICSLIPKSTILNEVRGIRVLSLVFVTVACLVAIAIVIIITKAITNTINNINESVSLAAQGDLTVEFNTNRKDEFNTLSKGISDMIRHMSNLIGDVQGVGETVSNSARHLTHTSSELLEATKGISATIDDIGGGIIHQAEDAEHCLIQMSGLADQIGQLYENTNENEKIADYTQSVTNDGIHIIEELNDKSIATSEITQDVIIKIQEFEVQSKKIESFVNIINEIASQTNLLSLNASIEAARAGEAGRGFAVVAEEIRKLADQSIKAANQIQKTVSDIASQNKETVTTAKMAEEIVASQTEALKRTINVFNNISKHVNSLADNFKNILVRLDNIESVKEETLNSIQNISAVTEETAAASQQMNATALLQTESVERLRESIIVLEKDSKVLEESIKKFKVEKS